MSRANDKKAQQLGMPFGTACNRLRKMVLFHLLKKLGDNVCFQCSNGIESVDDLSIEHKISWLDSDPDLFWNLDNIAFSHLSCNIAASRVGKPPPKKIECDTGMAWCSSCRVQHPIEDFTKDRSRHSGLVARCKLSRRKIPTTL